MLIISIYPYPHNYTGERIWFGPLHRTHCSATVLSLLCIQYYCCAYKLLLCLQYYCCEYNTTAVHTVLLLCIQYYCCAYNTTAVHTVLLLCIQYYCCAYNSTAFVCAAVKLSLAVFFTSVNTNNHLVTCYDIVSLVST